MRAPCCWVPSSPSRYRLATRRTPRVPPIRPLASGPGPRRIRAAPALRPRRQQHFRPRQRTAPAIQPAAQAVAAPPRKARSQRHRPAARRPPTTLLPRRAPRPHLLASSQVDKEMSTLEHGRYSVQSKVDISSLAAVCSFHHAACQRAQLLVVETAVIENDNGDPVCQHAACDKAKTAI